MGVKHFWYRIDSDNVASIQWAKKLGRRIWKRTDKQVFFSVNLDEDEC
jgi:hypothetical protein